MFSAVLLNAIHLVTWKERHALIRIKQQYFFKIFMFKVLTDSV